MVTAHCSSWLRVTPLAPLVLKPLDFDLTMLLAFLFLQEVDGMP